MKDPREEIKRMEIKRIFMKRIAWEKKRVTDD